mgnify:CR=1 FL=1|nr:MAG TPA: head to tail adaptor [Caudoviricetes sp.]
MAGKGKPDLLAACRASLRIPAYCNDFDEEISDIIDAARSELHAGGVCPDKVADDEDGRIRLAIKVYVKANFGMDNPDSEKLMQSFDCMLTAMRGDSAYNGAAS